MVKVCILLSNRCRITAHEEEEEDLGTKIAPSNDPNPLIVCFLEILQKEVAVAPHYPIALSSHHPITASHCKDKMVLKFGDDACEALATWF